MPMITPHSGTNVEEIAERIFRISTPVPPTVIPGGFTFNQYLIVDESPLLFHTGLRRMFTLVRDAVASIVPIERPNTLAYRTSKPTSAVRSTTFSPRRPRQSRSVAE